MVIHVTRALYCTRFILFSQGLFIPFVVLLHFLIPVPALAHSTFTSPFLCTIIMSFSPCVLSKLLEPQNTYITLPLTSTPNPFRCPDRLRLYTFRSHARSLYEGFFLHVYPLIQYQYQVPLTGAGLGFNITSRPLPLPFNPSKSPKPPLHHY